MCLDGLLSELGGEREQEWRYEEWIRDRGRVGLSARKKGVKPLEPNLTRYKAMLEMNERLVNELQIKKSSQLVLALHSSQFR